tara:strand:+ start:1463 stop:1909 length:447 start_codon:yes stop_codon:yes gene_type:complete
MSTIKVDTYLTRGGASEIAIDKLKGASSASSISVVAEGGSTTTNLQQGLCKFFSNIIGTGTISTRDSFNQSSIADRGTGDYDFFFTNSMGNDDYSQMSNADSASGHICMNYSEGEQNSGGVRVYTTEIHSNGPTDSSVIMASIHGDLA